MSFYIKTVGNVQDRSEEIAEHVFEYSELRRHDSDLDARCAPSSLVLTQQLDHHVIGDE